VGGKKSLHLYLFELDNGLASVCRHKLPFLRTRPDSSTTTAGHLSWLSSVTDLDIVDSLEAADICFPPLNWNYYLQCNKIRGVVRFAEQARAAGKLVGIWASGDFEKIIPIRNAVLFQSGLNRSRRRQPMYAFEVPAFVRDYVEVYQGGELQVRKKQARPKIGFCGQARGRLPGLMVWMAKGLQLRGLYLIGRSPEVPPPFLPPWILRAKVLRILARSPLVETDFIIRNRYRAGVRSSQQRNDPFHPTNVEFVNNIFTTDYTVCIRGGGNFSKRLYETLCCGRIPIFVDTDCVLPYDFDVDWKRYCVWVEKSEVPFIAEKVADFHASLSPSGFEDMQRECRQLWQDRLSKQGFLSHFHEHFHFVFGKQKDVSA